MDQNTISYIKNKSKIDADQSSSENHHFSVALACKYSPNLAVVISQFIFWISFNKKNGKNFIDGRTWTHRSIKDIKTYFPYFSEQQLDRIINKLVDEEILIKGNFNKSQYDRTTWYAFKNEDLLEKKEFKQDVLFKDQILDTKKDLDFFSFSFLPNHIFDFYMKHLSGVQFKIVSVIYRKTYGWVDEKGNRKTEDAISLSQFKEITGCSKSTINEALQFLTHHKIIIKRLEGEVGNQIGVYSLAPFAKDDYVRLSKVFNKDK